MERPLVFANVTPPVEELLGELHQRCDASLDTALFSLEAVDVDPLQVQDLDALSNEVLEGDLTPRSPPRKRRRSRTPVPHRWKPRKESRPKWSEEEIEVVERELDTVGPRWRLISQKLPGRSEDAVRQAFNRKHGVVYKSRAGPQGPTGPRARWTPEEDEQLRVAIFEHGKKWLVIKRLKGFSQTPSAIKGRAYRLGFTDEL